MKLWIEYVSALSSSLLGDKWDPPFQRRKEKEMILGVFYLSGPYVPLSGWLHRRNGAACFFHCLDHQPRAHFGLLGSFSVPLQLDHPGSPARLLLASPDPSRSWLRRRRETATHAQSRNVPHWSGKRPRMMIVLNAASGHEAERVVNQDNKITIDCKSDRK